MQLPNWRARPACKSLINRMHPHVPVLKGMLGDMTKVRLQLFLLFSQVEMSSAGRGYAQHLRGAKAATY